MFAVTTRLLLRPGWPEDAGALFNAINDEAIVRNLASAPWPYKRSDAEEFLATPRPQLQPNFLIFRSNGQPPELLGSIGFGHDDDGHLELGYWIARDHWGKGYASEAGRAVLDIARSLGHAEMRAEHFSDNPASGKVLRKLGFRPTGRTVSRFSRGRGQETAAVQFSLSLAGDDSGDDVMRDIAA
ncbi:GNAT family N-acetyltransferase [Parasphingorhabdus sp.]|uniref:GNAT family N-acetyltransferase n=1 Tax=Parasphingorhabdus sp. TaxID=2709688 RepID=UPI003A91DF0C